MLQELEALRRAPVVDPFTGPALLSPEARACSSTKRWATGWRRAPGRRERGAHFAARSGRGALAARDPRGRSDDALGRRGRPPGRAQRLVPLRRAGVEGAGDPGRERRAAQLPAEPPPVKGFVRSNGHGRSAGTGCPWRAWRTWSCVPRARCRTRICAGCCSRRRAARASRGHLHQGHHGGNTNTATYGYQAFKGMARLVYRIYADDGREELVRGVEIVGTPLASINKILAMAIAARSSTATAGPRALRAGEHARAGDARGRDRAAANPQDTGVRPSCLAVAP